MVFGMPNEENKDDVKLSVKIVYNKEIVKENMKIKQKKNYMKLFGNKLKN